MNKRTLDEEIEHQRKIVDATQKAGHDQIGSLGYAAFNYELGRLDGLCQARMLRDEEAA